MSSQESYFPPRLRHGAHSIYVRPAEAAIGFEAIDSLMRTDEAMGRNPDLARLRDKLYAIEWPNDRQGEGVE